MWNIGFKNKDIKNNMDYPKTQGYDKSSKYFGTGFTLGLGLGYTF
jgi:hypothetical protein